VVHFKTRDRIQYKQIILSDFFRFPWIFDSRMQCIAIYLAPVVMQSNSGSFATTGFEVRFKFRPFLFFFISWVAKTQSIYWTKQVVWTRFSRKTIRPRHATSSSKLRSNQVSLTSFFLGWLLSLDAKERSDQYFLLSFIPNLFTGLSGCMLIVWFDL